METAFTGWNHEGLPLAGDLHNYRRGGAANDMELLKVSSKSNPNSVAGALAGVVREQGRAEMQAVGAGALNQAIKAVAIARGFLAPSGIDLVCVPAFIDVEIDGAEKTAIKLIVGPRKRKGRRTPQ